jgi:hypothetical protein
MDGDDGAHRIEVQTIGPKKRSFCGKVTLYVLKLKSAMAD